jgi:hypothetical protein
LAGCGGGGGGEVTQARDLVVLRGQSGEGLGAEVGELVDRAVRLGQALFERGVFVFEVSDLSIAWVGFLVGVLESGQSLLELDAEVGVGAVAVKGGAVDAGFSELEMILLFGGPVVSSVGHAELDGGG